MKFLYLDIDGVMLPFDYLYQTNDANTMKPSCVRMLDAFCKNNPDLRIVISSTWRKHENEPGNIIRQWPEIPLFNPMNIDYAQYGDLSTTWCTPSLRSGIRGEEIAHHVSLYKPESFVILDDGVFDIKSVKADGFNDYAKIEIPSRVIKVYGKRGLTAQHLKKASEILARPYIKQPVEA